MKALMVSPLFQATHCEKYIQARQSAPAPCNQFPRLSTSQRRQGGGKI